MRRGGGQGGSVMSQSMLATVVVGTIILVISTATMTSIFGERDVRQRTGAQRAAEDGQSLYGEALEAGQATEATGWAVARADLERLVEGRGEVVDVATLSDAPRELRTVAAGLPAVVVRTKAGDAWHYWQLVRIVGPGSGSVDGAVVSWTRGWVGNDRGSVAGATALVRSSWRPGVFQQFQMLVDGPVSFAAGSAISGPVHSNGTGVGGGAALSAQGGISCTGEFARLSVGRGTIAQSMPAGCRRVGTASRVWNLAEVRETFDGIRRASERGGSGVVVVAGGAAAVPVRLMGANVQVGSALHPVGGGLAVLVHGDVVVSGTSDGRVTIASDPSRGSYHGRGGTIFVDGDVRTNGQQAVVGLFTEGDVVLDPTRCISHVRAAVVASRGSLSIDPSLMTDVAQNDVPQCGAFEHVGALATRSQPTLYWSWPSGQWTGYSSRTWSWDARLVRQPPPWAPVVDGWQLTESRPEDLSCTTGGPAGGWDTGRCT